MTPSARRDLMSRNPWTSFLLGSGLLGLLGIAPAAAVSLNAVSPNPASPNRTVVAQVVTIIERDSDGPLVLELQRRLTELGIYDGPISGFFGELTEAAVIQFQQSQGLTADGIVGPTTAEALRAADSGG
ncbi:MAG: peptidoglycan-binding domain-containing protein, partial [Cyanobacteria bacterium P01_A01_bin.135]